MRISSGGDQSAGAKIRGVAKRSTGAHALPLEAFFLSKIFSYFLNVTSFEIWWSVFAKKHLLWKVKAGRVFSMVSDTLSKMVHEKIDFKYF